MRSNNAYTVAITTSMENVTKQMQPVLKLTRKRSLPSSIQELSSYVESLLDIQEECLLSPEEQDMCDRATD